jgi:hypothetical protein
VAFRGRVAISCGFVSSFPSGAQSVGIRGDELPGLSITGRSCGHTLVRDLDAGHGDGSDVAGVGVDVETRDDLGSVRHDGQRLPFTGVGMRARWNRQDVDGSGRDAFL